MPNRGKRIILLILKVFYWRRTNERDFFMHPIPYSNIGKRWIFHTPAIWIYVALPDVTLSIKSTSGYDSFLLIRPLSRIIHLFFSPVSRPLPDDALGSELAVELWVETVAARIDIKTLATLPAESCFVLLTNPNRLPVRMIRALHFVLPFTSIIRQEPLPGQRPPSPLKSCCPSQTLHVEPSPLTNAIIW